MDEIEKLIADIDAAFQRFSDAEPPAPVRRTCANGVAAVIGQLADVNWQVKNNPVRWV